MRKGILLALGSLAVAAGVTSAQDGQPKAAQDGKPPISTQEGQPKANPDAKAMPSQEGQPPAAKDDGKAAVVVPDGQPQSIQDGRPPISVSAGDGQAGGAFQERQGENFWTQSGDIDATTRGWVTMEYMLWWLQNSPVPGPLATTSSPTNGSKLAGTLGQADTKVLYGNGSLDYGTFQGTRLTVGGWLDCEHTFGAEVSGFMLEQRSTHFAASSDASGNPPLYVPAFNSVLNREDSLIVANAPNQFAGSLLWDSEIRLWGMEANGVWAAWSNGNAHVALLGGFRFIDLEEGLGLSNSTVDLTDNVVTSLQDRFSTRNQFYGGQIGAKAGYVYNFLSIDVIGKIALGDMHQTVDINGNTTQSGTSAPTPGTFPGGFFTQPTNIGHQSRDTFAVVPELEVKIGCEIVPGLRAFVGYDLLYLSSVVRPGSQIDRDLNLTQSQFFGNGALTGTARPEALFNKTDFSANGLSFGMEYRW